MTHSFEESDGCRAWNDHQMLVHYDCAWSSLLVTLATMQGNQPLFKQQFYIFQSTWAATYVSRLVKFWIFQPLWPVEENFNGPGDVIGITVKGRKVRYLYWELVLQSLLVKTERWFLPEKPSMPDKINTLRAAYWAVRGEGVCAVCVWTYQVDVVKDLCGAVHLSQDDDHLVVDELFELPQVTHHLHLQLCADLEAHTTVKTRVWVCTCVSFFY